MLPEDYLKKEAVQWQKLKKYTLNLDIEVEAKNEVEAIQKICTPIYKAGLTILGG